MEPPSVRLLRQTNCAVGLTRGFAAEMGIARNGVVALFLAMGGVGGLVVVWCLGGDGVDGGGVDVGFVSGAEGGGLAVVVGDQAGAAGAVEVGVPGPGEVAGVFGVHPLGERGDVFGGAVVLADFAGDEGDFGGDGGDLVVPAGLGAAGVEVVGVPGRGEVVVGVGWLVGEPAGEVVGPGEPAGHDDVGGAGGADGVEHGLHAGDGVADAGAGAAVQPAGPALGGAAVGGLLGVGLVEQVEDDRVGALEGAGY